jgi:hypothetical protein
MVEKKFGRFDGEMLIGKARDSDLQKKAKELAEESITIEEGKIKKVCSVCGKVYGTLETEGEGNVTHGCCPKHQAEHKEKVRQEMADRIAAEKEKEGD